MQDQAVSPAEHAGIGSLTIIAESARDYLRQSKAQNTRRAYRSDWAHFQVRCGQHSRTTLPATEETLALNFSDLASTHKTSTLQRRVASISHDHQLAGFEAPTRGPVIHGVLASIRGANGTAPAVKMPVLTEDPAPYQGHVAKSARLPRLRASTARFCQPAHSAAPSWSPSIARTSISSVEGLIVTLRRSKTDPEAQGRKIGIPLGSAKTCAVRAIEEWTKRTNITSGPRFRPVNRRGRIAGIRISDKTAPPL